MNEYKVLPISVSNKTVFTEASKEELRVLIALIECEGRFTDTDDLAEMSKTSRSRCTSSLALWEDAGVIEKITDRAQTITEEFEQRLRQGEIREESATTVAKQIRNNSLSDMLSEIAIILHRPSLSTPEIKDLTALHEQYALSEEFIVTLAAYLAGEGKLTVTKLVNKALKLSEREIDTPELLTEYIVEKSLEGEAEKEFRKIFGIFGRAPSKTERECFIKWSKEYGYFTEIVGEAYDIAVNSVTRGYVKYADKLLTRWYECKCRTLSECRERYDLDKSEKAKEKETKKLSSAPAKKSTARYGDFDVNDAFMKALERSYGTDGK